MVRIHKLEEFIAETNGWLEAFELPDRLEVRSGHGYDLVAVAPEDLGHNVHRSGAFQALCHGSRRDIEFYVRGIRQALWMLYTKRAFTKGDKCYQ